MSSQPYRTIALDQIPNTDRSPKTTTQLAAQGVLESLTVGLTGGGSVIRKGDCFVQVNLLDSEKQAFARPVEGYAFSQNDPTWTGRLHLTDSDSISLTSYNGNSNLVKIIVRGRLFIEQ